MSAALTTPVPAGTDPALVRRRVRRGRPVPPAWACENCDESNEGRRRRCFDCGTTRA